MKHKTHAVSRDPALDLVRSVAIFMVVATHVTTAALYLPIGTAGWWQGLIWGALIRPSVPLFFMCSGALMLTRDIPLRRLYGHNLLRVVIAMLCWAFLYRLYYLLPGGLTLAGLWDAVKHTLVLDHEFHFYYLHILILVYFFLPPVRVFLRSAARREEEYLLAGWFLTGILFPLLKTVWPFTLVGPIGTRWLMPMAYSAIGYSVLGHYLRSYGDTVRRRWYLLAFGAGLLLTFAGSAAESLSSGVLSTRFMEGMSPGPALMSAGIFGLILSARRPTESLSRVAGRLSRASFCIYLVHVFFLYLLQGAGITSAARLPLLTIPGITLLILLLSWLVYEVLARIPVVKDWLV